MKRIIPIAMVFIGMAFTGMAIGVATAQTQDPSGTSKAFQDCMDNVDLGALKNSQWSECYAAELARQDKALNTEYRALQSRIPTEARDLLVRGQRSWIAYRDGWCKLEAEMPHAPGGQVNYLACMVDQTVAQIKRLKDL